MSKNSAEAASTTKVEGAEQNTTSAQEGAAEDAKKGKRNYKSPTVHKS